MFLLSRLLLLYSQLKIYPKRDVNLMIDIEFIVVFAI